MSIVIVEDEAHLREAVAEYLAARGLTVHAAGDAAELRRLAEGERFDVAILDINMPGEDGLSLARWLRKAQPRAGIIFATAADAPVDRIVGLESGADDYLTKPYELRELLARVRSVMRRVGPAEDAARAPAPVPPAEDRIAVGAFTLHAAANRVSAPDGRSVALTAAEADLLQALATRPNRVLSRAQLVALLGGEAGETGREIDVRVARLRRKLREAGLVADVIQTVRGEGYVFVPDRP